MNNTIAPWLLKSKVSPPKQLLSVIDRSRLTAKLDDGLNGSLILLEAPGGYGKSSVLSQWRDQLVAAGSIVCWMSVDEDDDPETFVSYLAFAAHQAGLNATSSGLLSFEFSADRPSHQSVYQWLALVERAPGQVVVILDDFERCSPEVRETILPLLLRRLPEKVTIVIASREPFDVSTVDLEHRGLILKLGADELRFARPEMAKLWKGRLTPRQIDRLAERTQGWPVLIRLLLTASDMGAFDIRHIDDFGYRDSAITAYFEEKILRRLGPKERELLFECSIFDDVTPDLFEGVLSYPSDDFLGRFEKLEAFITPLSDDDAGLRLHPMMREYLRRTFKENSPEQFADIQRKAALWFSAQSNHVRAVKHAHELGDEALVVSLLEATEGLKLWLQEGLIEFRAIDRYISDDVLVRSPTSALMRCVILMKTGRQSEAKAVLDQSLKLHGEVIGSDVTLSVSSTMIKLMHSVYSGRQIVIADIEQIENAIASEGRTNLAFLGFVYNFKCVAAHQAGELVGALEFAAKALEVFREMGSVYGEAYIHLHRAMIQGFVDSIDASEVELQKASDLIRKELSYDDGIRYLSDVLSIETEHEHQPQSLKRAARLKNIVTKLIKAEGWLDIYAGAFRTLADQAYLAGGGVDSLHFLELATEFASKNHVENLSRIASAQAALIHLANNDLGGAKSERAYQAVRSGYQPMTLLQELPWRVIEAEAELALVLAHQGHLEIDDQAFEELIDFAVERQNLRLACRISALLAILPGRENSERELEFLRGNVGPVKFERATLFVAQPLIEKIEKTPNPDHYTDLTDLLMRQRKDWGRGVIEDGAASIVTEKERAVLIELQKGDTDKQIAITLGVTEHAVRYHLKNLYLKFSVKSRNDAVRRAVEIGAL